MIDEVLGEDPPDDLREALLELQDAARRAYLEGARAQEIRLITRKTHTLSAKEEIESKRARHERS